MRRRGFAPLSAILLLLHSSTALAAASLPNCAPPRGRAERLAPLARGLAEASGMAASRRNPGIGWMIRDSGRPASIYAFRIVDGHPRVREVKVLGAENTDWEDVTYSIGRDGRGRLWIVESMQSHRDPYIYEVMEPDPDKAETVRLHRRHRFKYPGSRFHNTEASFWFGRHLVLATKSNPTRLYRLPALTGKGTHRPEYVGALFDAPRLSVLRPSPDRSALVASDHETLSVFTGKGPGSRLAHFVNKGPAHRTRLFPNDNVEAGDYFPTGSCQMILLSEARQVYRIRSR